MDQTIQVNEVDLRDMLLRRQSFAGSLDTKRPRAWDQFGWPEQVTHEMMLSAYKRNGVAAGAVHHLLERCWQSAPRFKRKGSETETLWEREVVELLDAIEAWPKLVEWDRRNMVGRYAALVLRFRDGRPPDQPVSTGAELIDVVPMYEHQVRVARWDTDLSSETYGKPTMYEYAQRDITGADRQAKPQRFEMLHPSRVVMLAEGSVGDDFLEGTPLLEAGYNAIVDIEKVAGGSAEGYLKNSARTLTFTFDKDADPMKIVGTKADGSRATAADVTAAVQERAERLNKNIDAAAIAQGATVGTLNTTMNDPEEAFMTAVSVFAASVRIPATILIGQQTGRLASDEDDRAFNRRCEARRTNVLTPALRAMVRALQKAGAVPTGEFDIEWESLEASTDEEEAALADKLAGINQKMVAAGRNAPFKENEVRAAAGYEEDPELADLPLVDDEPDPALTEGAPTAQPPAQPTQPAQSAQPAQPAANAVIEFLRNAKLWPW
jgi:hypothetical protein